MKISIYTFVKDGIYFDYHIVQMLRHHLPLADEIVVNEGYSSDDTYDRIKNLDSKIKVFREHWDLSDETWYVKFKEKARKNCSGDWCILVDADEFIPEWEFANIRNYLERSEKIMIPMKYTHFYGNYKVYNKNPKKSGWPIFKYSIHRNRDDIEIWGDGSNVKLKNQQGKLELEKLDKYFECHHFGFVRKPARLRHKWRIQNSPFLRSKLARTIGFLFDLRPHDWLDRDFMDDLSIYDGPFIKAVREDPSEFVRDNFKIYDLLRRSEQ